MAAHVGSVVGPISGNPFINIKPVNQIGRGVTADLSIQFTPNIYLWFWLLPNGDYSLHSSSIECLTSWGAIDVPLTDKISDELRGINRSIEEFQDRVRRALGINQ
jgi:hypothetical protein